MKLEEKKITEAVIRLFDKEHDFEHKLEVQFCTKFLDLYSYDKQNDNFIAVESKVNSVSRAFNQALNYRHLATFVYVALYRNRTNKKAIELSSSTGIGLILVKRDKLNRYCAELVISAKRSKFHNNRIAEHVWNGYNQELKYA